MAIGLGIGLLLITLGIVCEFVVAHFDTPVASPPVTPLVS